jgi:hypothetical protein
METTLSDLPERSMDNMLDLDKQFDLDRLTYQPIDVPAI